MTRRSTKELFTPFENTEQVLRSSRKLSKTRSLDYLNSLEFNLISNLKYQFEEEEIEAMAETMEEYMTKTRDGYGSGIARPKIDDKVHFELKGQFIKELCDNTFSGSDHEDANEHIEKVLEIDVILPTRKILDSKCAIATMTAADAKVAIQEMAEHSKKWHHGTSTRTRSIKTFDGLAAIQAQLNNVGREIKKVEFFEGWKPLSPLQLAVEEVMSE
ncbi:hypothetical protein Tco_0674531 [Tanacetum coccineum]